MGESARYENPEMWASDRYLGNPDEVARFHACAALVPHGVSTLLDVGAGNGAFLSVLERSRPEIAARGLERARSAIVRAECAAEIVEGSAAELPFTDRTFDTVSALEVIEHLPYGVYGRALAEIERVAARHVLVSVPFRERRVWVECPCCACVFNPPYHMRTFDEAALRGLFRGFRCVELRPVTVRDVALGALLKPLFRWARARAGFFPPQAVCPQCGYLQAGAESGGAPRARVAARTRGALRLGRAARRILPSVRRTLWMIALYERVEAA